jgi:hypothetical protein
MIIFMERERKYIVTVLNMKVIIILEKDKDLENYVIKMDHTIKDIG